MAKGVAFRTDRGVRDIRTQKETAEQRDREHEKRQKARDDAARKRADELAKAGKVVAAKQGFSYPSKELGGQMRPIQRGEVFHPSDEPVQFAPANFKEALSV